MTRPVTAIPYTPHRYVDELTDSAWEHFGAWRLAARSGEYEARMLAMRMHLMLVTTNAEYPDETIERPVDALFEDIAAALVRLPKGETRSNAIAAIFGGGARMDVNRLAVDCVEEPKMPAGPHDLEGRIVARIWRGAFNDADFAWVQRRAAELVTDEDLLRIAPFDGGKEGEIRELSRRVVRGRRDHVCHWTGLVIPAGEPHLMLTELIDGEFFRTRHSRTTAWCEVYAHDGTLAEMLKLHTVVPLAAAA